MVPSALGFHAVNVLLHGGTSVLVYLLLRGLILDPGPRVSSVFASPALVGAVLVLNDGSDPSTLGGGAAVRLSTCALAAVGWSAATARAFRDRFWLDLY